ncbi:HlyD family secretion protein [Dictyobacter arantiisoli]|uniref:AprE-like beta-barrel domain-containing protein n=1 Tax=Dictyobacter arantiisoli TaxID=2014874 RepID=A0A5A5TGW8_9CHLR|nr:hypothetical protein [Dictyobacter arantiisoli]GCF10820.1 hypothetical protein KDI_43840 [Dictyobacter arantiisoli]
MLQTPGRALCPPPEMVEDTTLLTGDPPLAPPKWRQRKNAIWIPFILLIIVLGGFFFRPLDWAIGFPGQLMRPTQGPGINAYGVLQAPTFNLVFSSSVTGVISDIDVAIGQHVVENQVLSHLGLNTYVAQVHAAQVAVDAAREEVRAAIIHLEAEDRFIAASVHLARVTLQAERNNRQALIRQAQANIRFARVTLQADRNTLRAVIEAAEASVASARLTLISALQACQTAAATATPTNGNGSDGASQPSPLQSCIQAAEAAFRVATTSARVSVVTAQGTVRKDEAALQQAFANADVSLVAAAGRIAEAAASIQVAQANPDRSNAFLSLTAAEFTYRTSLANLLIAEQLLSFTALRAPHDAVVTAIIGSIGGQPGAVNNLVPSGGLEIQSDHGGLTFIQLVDIDHINAIQCFVDETDISKVQFGQTAVFTLKALGKRKLTGTVNEISANGLGYPNTTNTRFPVFISIPPESTHDSGLFSGMTGNVVISP